MKIVIDPGHGGHTKVGGSSPNNASGPDGMLEKNISLDIGKRIHALVQSKATSLLTRSTDVNLGLTARAKKSRGFDADAFVSIHFNGWDGQVQGTETWVHTRSSTASKSLAAALQRNMLDATRYRNRGVKMANFGVLNPNYHADNTAACLVEISFMDVREEEDRLGAEAYKDKIAKSIANGLLDWLRSGSRSQFDVEAFDAMPDLEVDDLEDGFDLLRNISKSD